MSEHQLIAFRAIDGPVSEKNLEFMQRQSSRAEITAWSFDNEYQYGDFRGDAAEMLRRGYDFHLHYANFGVRSLMIRLPQGLPEGAQPYFGDEALRFLKDKQGPGGSIVVAPFHEPGEFEELWDIDELVERLLPLRAEILDGDLRPLYLAHLAAVSDGNHDPEETREGPVPAGLNKLSKAQRALVELYELEALAAAAARNAPAVVETVDSQKLLAEWLVRQPAAAKDAWLTRLLADSPAQVKTDIVTEFRKSNTSPAWPTTRLDRTIAELQGAAQHIEKESQQRAMEKVARERAEKLAALAANPEAACRQTEQLVAQRSRQAYSQAAELLADLRAALADSDQADLADKQASKLRKNNPKLNTLVAELRRKQFLKK